MSRTNILSKTKVLIVDDQPANIIATELTLKSIEVEVLSAYSGAEAIGVLLRHDDVGLILMDVQMPEMDGFETAELIRQDNSIRHIPIIFVTAINKEDKYVFRGYEAGAVDYLFKPLDSDVLIGKVKVFVQLHQQQLQMKAALDTIQQLQKEHKLLLDHVGEGIVGINVEGVITFSNPAAEKLLGYDKDTLLGVELKKLVSLDDIDRYNELLGMSEQAAAVDQLTLEMFFLNATGETVEVSCTKAIITDGKKEKGSVILFQDISERKLAQQKLENLAQYDQLTQLANRLYFTDFLTKMLANATRHDGRFALFFIDLDKFKAVNDTMGHDAGDLLLVQTAKRLNECVREGDLVCRLGGDEFAVILNFIDTPDIAATLAQRMLDSLHRPFMLKEKEALIGGSIGIAVYPGHGDTVEEMVKSADTAMYIAKSNGRNNFQFFHQDIQRSVEKHITMANDLKEACLNNNLELYYQPIYRLSDGFMVGAEALLRWPNSKYDETPTKTFIELAESFSFIDELDRWVLAKAGQQIPLFVSANGTDCPFYLSVNISPQKFKQKSLIEDLRELLTTSEIDPWNLILDLSETAIMSNLPESMMKLEEIRALNVRVSIDDVGTAASSLRMLPKLHIDALKIDNEIVQGIGQDESAEKTVRAIIGISSSIGVKTIAEGIETEEQMLFLKELGCEKGQGYFFQSPLSSDDMIKLIGNRG